MTNKVAKRLNRHRRVRKTVVGKSEKPRLTVFRSQKHIYAQIIDDQEGKTLASASDVKAKDAKSDEGKMKEKRARQVGQEIAKAAVAKKLKTVVFDRGGYKYHGRIKALAEGAREGGLDF